MSYLSTIISRWWTLNRYGEKMFHHILVDNHHPKPIALHSGKNTQKHTNFKPFAEPLEQVKY